MYMMTSSNGNIFHVAGPLCVEFTGPHKGQGHEISALKNGWVNNRETGDLRRHRAHYDVIVMWVIAAMIFGEITRPRPSVNGGLTKPPL